MKRALTALGLCAVMAPAHGRAEPNPDRIGYRAQVDVVSRLFRRQTFPDATGAIVAGDVAIPLYHYALLRVDDVDTPWRADSVDVELAAWGDLQLADPGAYRIDGDIHVANARHRFDHAHVRVGRQVRSGGAARYAHFDGVAAGARTDFSGGRHRTELGIDGYGGFVVLPRWNARPGYQQLGSAADTFLRDPAAIPEPAREDAWLTGGRAFVTVPSKVTAGVSFHEQHTAAGLDRRNGAFDLALMPIDEMAWHAQAILDMDADALADLRAGLDVYPHRDVTLRGGYQHLSPALLLSRQSVLSVFSTEAFDEWGIEADWQIARPFRVSGFGYGLRFDDGSFGVRGGGTVRFSSAGPTPVMAMAGYRRISEAQNGYHGLRASFGVTPVSQLRLVGDAFVYLYDEPIEGFSASMVGVLSAAHPLGEHVDAMLASSVSRSPYADVDVQGTARIRVRFEGGGR